jgi:adenylate cyclase
MGETVEAEGGRVDKFLGDGVMAPFGVDQGPETACRQVLAAASAMAIALEQLNQELVRDLAEPCASGSGCTSGR